MVLYVTSSGHLALTASLRFSSATTASANKGIAIHSARV